jgi:hypothetical protein
MKKWLCFLLCLPLITVNLAYAQSEDDFVKNTQNDILLVGAAGAGGAILGLSTLSFYDKPSKHVANVWTGAAIGIIAGVIFVAYMSAQKGSEDLTSQHSSEEFTTSDRANWHADAAPILTIPSVQIGTQFWTTTF